MSYVERQNLTMRMHLRRFARLTNAFSEKLEMHAASVALHFMHDNFCRNSSDARRYASDASRDFRPRLGTD
jgi:hypothetical protein